MNREALQSLLRSRLGDDYSHEVWQQVSELRESLLAEQLVRLKRAQQGEIDGATFADQMNELASQAIIKLRSILGERFHDVVGVEDGFVLVDPAIASQVDFAQIDASEFVTRTGVYNVLQDPKCLEILARLSNGPLTMQQLAEAAGKQRSQLERRLALLEGVQLVSSDDPRSLTWRVKRVSSEGGESALLITDDSGEPQIFWMSHVDGLDPYRANRLAAELSGLWEYECRATSDVKFNDEEAGRGGQMSISARAHSYGVDAELIAKRLWYRAPDGAQHVVTPPVEWKCEGGVTITQGKLSFRYTIDGLGGMTNDRYEITDEHLEMLKGEFVHIRSDGQRVTGTVQLRRVHDTDAPVQLPVSSRTPS